MIDKLNEILKGIDKDQCDSSDGWWETSSGAEFGAKKLKEVQDLVKKLTLTGVSQQRELLKAYAELIQSSYTNHFFDDAVEESIDEFLSL
tara:strand:+ start:1951 stop:2220 length:270 start_codon:yes stop_codon:yes gene_type:complete